MALIGPCSTLDQAREFVPALREALLANIQALDYLGRREDALTLHLELTFLLRRTQHEVIQHGSQLRSRQATAAAARGRQRVGPKAWQCTPASASGTPVRRHRSRCAGSQSRQAPVRERSIATPLRHWHPPTFTKPSRCFFALLLSSL